jgi:hypothetical protein
MRFPPTRCSQLSRESACNDAILDVKTSKTVRKLVMARAL